MDSQRGGSIPFRGQARGRGRGAHRGAANNSHAHSGVTDNKTEMYRQLEQAVQGAQAAEATQVQPHLSMQQITQLPPANHNAHHMNHAQSTTALHSANHRSEEFAPPQQSARGRGAPQAGRGARGMRGSQSTASIRGGIAYDASHNNNNRGGISSVPLRPPQSKSRGIFMPPPPKGAINPIVQQATVAQGQRPPSRGRGGAQTAATRHSAPRSAADQADEAQDSGDEDFMKMLIRSGQIQTAPDGRPSASATVARADAAAVQQSQSPPPQRQNGKSKHLQSNKKAIEEFSIQDLQSEPLRQDERLSTADGGIANQGRGSRRNNTSASGAKSQSRQAQKEQLLEQSHRRTAHAQTAVRDSQHMSNNDRQDVSSASKPQPQRNSRPVSAQQHQMSTPLSKGLRQPTQATQATPVTDDYSAATAASDAAYMRRDDLARQNSAIPAPTSAAQPARDRGRQHFPDHLPLDEMRAGLEAGKYVSGQIRIISQSAFVTVKGQLRDICLDDRRARNRAFDGDIVCVQIIQDASIMQGKKQKEHKSVFDEQNESFSDEEDEDEDKIEDLLSGMSIGDSAKKQASTESDIQTGTESEATSVVAFDPTPAEAKSLVAAKKSAPLPPQLQGRVVGILRHKPQTTVPGFLSAMPGHDHLAEFRPLDKRMPLAFVRRSDCTPQVIKDVFGTHKALTRAQQLDKQQRKNQQSQSGRKLGATSSNAETSSTEFTDETVSDMTDSEEPRHIYLVTLYPWRATDRYPFAKCEEDADLGLSGSIAVETRALLAQYGVNYSNDFSAEIMAEIDSYETRGESVDANAEWQIPAEEIAKRVDLRQHRIVSIDPPNARDLDDALHIVPLGGGFHRIGVSIADVSYFLTQDRTPKLEAEAKYRATTVYLTSQAITMLPSVLCERLCSLNPGVDRLAFTCEFVMSEKDGSVCEANHAKPEFRPRFFKSVIRTCSRLTYADAQLMIDAKGHAEQDWSPELAAVLTPGSRACPPAASKIERSRVVEDVRLMNVIALARRAKRFENGSLTLTNVKLLFDLDKENGLPLGFVTYPILDSNRLIEEFMLLANMLVAKRLVTYVPDIALLRRHAPPAQHSMDQVIETCAAMGYEIDASSAGTLQACLARYSHTELGSDALSARSVLEPIVTRPMLQARYIAAAMAESPQDYHHYALAFTHYTHFTSPIRRFADVLVHRALEFSIQVEEEMRVKKIADPRKVTLTPPFGLTAGYVDDSADHCNQRKVAAKKASDRSSVVYLCDYIKTHFPVGMNERGIILNMSDDYVEILIPRLGIEKRVNLTEIQDCTSADVTPKQLIEGKQSGNARNNRRGQQQKGGRQGQSANKSVGSGSRQFSSNKERNGNRRRQREEKAHAQQFEAQAKDMFSSNPLAQQRAKDSVSAVASGEESQTDSSELVHRGQTLVNKTDDKARSTDGQSTGGQSQGNLTSDSVRSKAAKSDVGNTRVAAAPDASAPVLASDKRLTIHWRQSLVQVFRIFDGIDVRLCIKSRPQCDVFIAIRSPSPSPVVAPVGGQVGAAVTESADTQSHLPASAVIRCESPTDPLQIANDEL